VRQLAESLAGRTTCPHVWHVRCSSPDSHHLTNCRRTGTEPYGHGRPKFPCTAAKSLELTKPLQSASPSPVTGSAGRPKLACTAAKSVEFTKPFLFASPMQLHTTVDVAVAVDVGVLVPVEVDVGVTVRVAVFVAVSVLVAVGVWITVWVGVGVSVRVGVGVLVGPDGDCPLNS
jgi:hypothetical protein